jgi:hypothetical protein
VDVAGTSGPDIREELTMDIRCPRCTEPWDLDTLHDTAEANGVTFAAVRRAFYADGCAALTQPGWVIAPCEPVDSPQAAMLGVLAELMGDDVDGYCADAEDLIFGL